MEELTKELNEEEALIRQALVCAYEKGKLDSHQEELTKLDTRIKIVNECASYAENGFSVFEKAVLYSMIKHIAEMEL